MPYLSLWHGRSHPDEELSHWGEVGPVLGPFPFFRMTYGCEIKFSADDRHVLNIVCGMVHYDGRFYGDWSFVETLDEGMRCRLIPFDPAKAKVPQSIAD
jgi:hypothetical protein